MNRQPDKSKRKQPESSASFWVDVRFSNQGVQGLCYPQHTTDGHCWRWWKEKRFGRALSWSKGVLDIHYVSVEGTVYQRFFACLDLTLGAIFPMQRYIRYFDEFILPTNESSRMKPLTDECIEGGARHGLASSELRTSKSNRTPKLSKHVPGKRFPCSGLGRTKKASLAGKGVNEAVARCGDLKLTLRQRLEK